MLRITVDHDQTSTATIRLEGRLSGAAIEEFTDVCASLDESGDWNLNLSGMSWLDEAGATFIRELIDRGVSVTGAKPFVWILLRRPPQ